VHPVGSAAFGYQGDPAWPLFACFFDSECARYIGEKFRHQTDCNTRRGSEGHFGLTNPFGIQTAGDQQVFIAKFYMLKFRTQIWLKSL
jgi:hypothetical protein